MHCFLHPSEYYDDVCPKCTQEEKEMNQTRENELRRYAQQIAAENFQMLNQKTIGVTRCMTESDFFQNEVSQELGYLIHGQQANQTTVTREMHRDLAKPAKDVTAAETLKAIENAPA